MQFMQMAPMQKGNQQAQSMALLQAALARGGGRTTGAGMTPAEAGKVMQAPAPGQIMPGGAMNIQPGQPGGFMQMLGGQGLPQMGLLAKLLGGLGGGQGGGTMQPPSSEAIY